MAAGNATFANESVTMADENAAFADVDVFFADGNAAARRSGGHTGAAPTISRMVCVIRLQSNSSPLHKIKEDCVVEVFDGGW